MSSSGPPAFTLDGLTEAVREGVLQELEAREADFLRRAPVPDADAVYQALARSLMPGIATGLAVFRQFSSKHLLEGVCEAPGDEPDPRPDPHAADRAARLIALDAELTALLTEVRDLAQAVREERRHRGLAQAQARHRERLLPEVSRPMPAPAAEPHALASALRRVCAVDRAVLAPGCDEET